MPSITPSPGAGNLVERYIGSPSHIAKKVASFRLFYSLGDNAQRKLVRLRNYYNNELYLAMKNVKSEDDQKILQEVLWTGDKEGKEYTREELAAENIPANVAEAYVRIRKLVAEAWTMLDDAVRRSKNMTMWAAQSKIDELRGNKFVEILSISEERDEHGQQLVNYKEYAHRERALKGISKEALDKLKADDAMQILSEEETKNGKYNVKFREGIAQFGKIKGYMPHFWHRYVVQIVDAKGKFVGDPLTSGRTEREAIKLAEEWKAENPDGLKEGERIYIAPLMQDFGEFGMNEDNYAPVMGDKDFRRMVENIAKNNMITLEEARAMVDGAVKLKNRHRFLGNLLKRTGVEGYTRDMNYVLRHYFNSAARYTALETEFKPQAISMFERLFGAFDKDYGGKNPLADYVKDYINDVNGAPSTTEVVINEALNKSSLFRKFFVPTFGERAALTISNGITARVSYLYLGVGNVSSALLNLTQLINAGGYLGGYNRLGSKLKFDKNLTEQEVAILKELGTFYDIGLDTATGYDQNRGYGSDLQVLKQLDKIGNLSMGLFQYLDSRCRIATTLAAYEQGKAKGMKHTAAIEYARRINRAANFDYGVADAPNVFRRTGVVGKISLQFMKYPVKQLEVIYDLFPISKKTTKEQKAAFWLPYLAMCGLMGIPFLDWLDDLFGEKFGLFPKDYMQELVMKHAPNDTIAKMAMYGAPALFDIDVSKRAGLASIVPRDFWGAGVSMIHGVGSNIIFNGDYGNALRSVSPGAWNIMTALTGESYEKRDRLNTVYDGLYARILRGVGFKSVDETLPNDLKRIKNHREKALTQEKQSAIDEYIADPTTENAMWLKELGITKKQVDTERKKKQQTRRERFVGGMGKQAQERNRDLIEFGE